MSYLIKELQKLPDKETVIRAIEIIQRWDMWREHELCRVLCELTYDNDPKVKSLAKDALEEDSLNYHKFAEEFKQFIKDNIVG